MPVCNRCAEQGFIFERNYAPVEFIEGALDSSIWIIGLNPKDEGNGSDLRDSADLARHFAHEPLHPYFADFRTASERLFLALGKPQGTAHTDIVKCASKSFPKGKSGSAMVRNCSPILAEQLRRHRPRIVVCNGTQVSRFVKALLKPPASFTPAETSYWTEFEGQLVCVILSGYIGRIDNYSKRRLGIEIEKRLDELDGV